MHSRIFIVRHGETDWNKKLKFQGSKDIELNELGIAQARKAAERLAKEKITKVYASDLKRAYETAEIIANEHKLSVEGVIGLREINFGSWEGMTYVEIQEQYKDEWDKWVDNPVKNPTPKGEAFEDVRVRVKEAFERIVEENMGEDILIVAHGGVIKVLMSTLFGMPLERSWQLMQSNTAVNVINYYDNHKVTLELFNSTYHLDEEDLGLII